MKNKSSLSLVLLGLGLSFTTTQVSAQTGVAIGALTPDPSAALDISSTSQGLLAPRVALTGITDATTISQPATGLTVYNTAKGSLPLGLVSNTGTPTAPNWQASGAANSWALQGNAGTTPATAFLGTVDAQPLVFRTNNLEHARMVPGSGAFWLGGASTARQNVLVGYQAGQSSTGTTTATGNTFLGYQAGYSTTSGNANLFLGRATGYSTTSGSDNVFIGDNAGNGNSTGTQNVFIGSQAGWKFGGSSNNTMIGWHSGFVAFNQFNLYAYGNTYLGARSGGSAATGNGNTFLGWAAGEGNAADYNTYIGSQAGIGGGPAQTGTSNTFIGNQAGSFISSGGNNVLLGDNAGGGNTLSYPGQPTMYPGALTTGSNNTFIGVQAGLFSTTQRSNATAIGYQAKVGQDNSLVLGGTGQYAVKVGIGTVAPSEVLTVQGNILASGTITQNSDARLKTNVRQLSGALASVAKLRGVRYTFLPGKGPQGEQVGVIAQEVEAVYPELVRTDPTTGIKSVNYAQLTPVLLEAIKELEGKAATEREQYTASLDSLTKRIEALEGAAPARAASAAK